MRFQAVVRLTWRSCSRSSCRRCSPGSPSEALGLTVSVASFVAFSVTVAALDLRSRPARSGPAGEKQRGGAGRASSQRACILDSGLRVDLERLLGLASGPKFTRHVAVTPSGPRLGHAGVCLTARTCDAAMADRRAARGERHGGAEYRNRSAEWKPFGRSRRGLPVSESSRSPAGLQCWSARTGRTFVRMRRVTDAATGPRSYRRRHGRRGPRPVPVVIRHGAGGPAEPAGRCPGTTPG